MLEQLGATLTRRMQHRPALLLDAIVAARRDPELAALLRVRVAAREALLAELFQRALDDGAIDSDLDPDDARALLHDRSRWARSCSARSISHPRTRTTGTR